MEKILEKTSMIFIFLLLQAIVVRPYSGESSHERHTLTATAGQLVTISERHLPPPSDLERDLDPSQIEYLVSRPLSPEDGHLLLMYAPGMEVLGFTQADVRNMDLVYVPPPPHLVPTERTVTFKFSVSVPPRTTPGYNDLQVDLEETFSLLLLPLGHREPRFRVPDPVIKVGKDLVVNISRKYFEVEGFGEDSTNVVFMITEGPTFGSLFIIFADGRTRSLKPDEEFSAGEVRRSAAVQYRYHGGSEEDGGEEGGAGEARGDGFEVLATDLQAEAVSQLALRFEQDEQQSASREEVVTLQVNEGERVVLTSDYFSYALSGGGGRSQVSYTLLDTPHYGTLSLSARTLARGDSFSQDDANKGRLAYRAVAEVGRAQITERIPLRIADSSGSRYRPQLLAITIEPTDNQAPLMLVNGEIVVREGGSEVLPDQLITVMDADSSEEQLVLELDTPPTFGYLSLDSGGPAARFSVAELRRGSVRYVHSFHRGTEASRDALLLHASDGNNRSPSMRLNISIELVNDEPPVLVTESLEVEGGGAVVRNSSLFVSDLDTPPSSLMIVLLQEPSRGAVWRRESPDRPLYSGAPLTAGSVIKYMDVLDELITFVPAADVDNVTEDSVVFSVSDGDFVVQASLPILLSALHHDGPAAPARHTAALLVPSGGSHVLSMSELGGRGKRLVLLEAPAPGLHVQARRQGSLWSTLIGGDQFTSQDVTRGDVRLLHTYGGRIFPLRFQIEDDSQHVATMVVMVRVREDLAPPSLEVNSPLTVRANSSAVISTRHLAATDLDSPPGELLFTVTRVPRRGRLEARGGGVVSSWSQADLEEGRITFVHQGAPNEPSQQDNFEFSLSDGTKSVSGQFIVQLVPHEQEDAGRPLLSAVRAVQAWSGSRVVVSHFQLSAEATATPPEHVVFAVSVPPRLGALQLQYGEHFNVTSSFSMLDVLSGRVFYEHEAHELREDYDEAQLLLSCSGRPCEYAQPGSAAPTDEPITLPINIRHVETGMPTLVTNLGIMYLEYKDGEAVGFLSSPLLEVRDSVASPRRVVFTVTSPPSWGLLYTTATQGTPVSVFTQEDVNAGRIYYQLDNENEVTSTKDYFEFQVTDSKSNTLSTNYFQIQWSWISFEKSTYNVSETDGILRIKVVREGGVPLHSSTVRCRALPTGRTGGAATWGSNQPQNNDFELQHALVQFDNFEKEKYCVIKIYNDNEFEEVEEFTIELFEPSRTLLGSTRRTHVSLHDLEDQPKVTFKAKLRHVNETEGPVVLQIFRTGDLSTTVSVRCTTQAGTARPSNLTMNHADFMTRPDNEVSVITFAPGVDVVPCIVQIVDDALYEDSEDFFIVLTNPSSNAILGSITRLRVLIVGPNDVSQVHFSQTELSFFEHEGTVDIAVTRTGTDLHYNSSVWCTTHALDATPKTDYVPMSQQVIFSHGDSEAWCRLTILDDLVLPQLEGSERLRVVLSSADGATLVEPLSTTVIIDDITMDTPTLQFAESQVTVREDVGMLHVAVLRSGDVHHAASAKCYSSKRSAKEGEDFKDRPRTEASRIKFDPNQTLAHCDVTIIDDSLLEGEEDFVLRLAEPLFEELDTGQEKLALIGDKAVMRVKILDVEDTPRVHFEKRDFLVNEPSDEPLLLTLKVQREGDVSHAARVHVNSRDGSATSGSDYLAVSSDLTFHPGVKVIDLKVTVLPSSNSDDEERREERFFLVLDNDEASAAVVNIRSQSAGALVLPAQPLVVSLLHYDNASSGEDVNPDPGYPLVCISPCEERHPQYSKTRHLCEAVTFKTIEYFWEVAVQSGLQSIRLTTFNKLTKSTIFAKVDSKVLDTIYFTSNFQIRCGTQPIKLNGRLGIPIKSQIVTIGISNQFCNSDNRNQVFNANLKYINSTFESHPNTVHIKIEVPHSDGRVPLISTHPLHNVRSLLTEPLYSAQHSCSNLVEDRAFLADSIHVSEDKVYIEDRGLFLHPHERDSKLRGAETVHLYRHLDLRTCLWKFDAWFHMTELIDSCHGKVVSEFQVAEQGQSELSVEVPLYVAYVSASGVQEWSAVEHRTILQVSLRYSALLWHQGGLQTEPSFAANLHVSRVSANDEGQLVVEFWTEALFRGMFVTSHPTLARQHSTLVAPRHLTGLGFSLELVWSEGTWDGPRQHWRATSNASLTDFSGQYWALLVPCAAQLGAPYSEATPPPCHAHSPSRIALNVEFQVAARPLPAQYALQTQFELTNNPSQFLADPADPQYLQGGDAAWRFGAGELVLGRVSWHPSQDLRTAYRLQIERVLVCAGREGAQPQLDPTGELHGRGVQLGCLHPSPALAHRFVLLDREAPDAAERHVRGVQFEARFARDVPQFRALEAFPGVDGFVWKVDPLYQVNSGHQWFMQVLYRIRSSDSAERPRRDSSSELGPMVSLWQQGSAMRPLLLAESGSEDSWRHSTVLPVVALLVLPLLAAVCLMALRLHERCARSSYTLATPPTPE